MQKLLNDFEHWQECAKRARQIAEQLSGEEAKTLMLQAAQDYEDLAKRAKQRSKATSR